MGIATTTLNSDDGEKQWHLSVRAQSTLWATLSLLNLLFSSLALLPTDPIRLSLFFPPLDYVPINARHHDRSGHCHRTRPASRERPRNLWGGRLLSGIACALGTRRLWLSVARACQLRLFESALSGATLLPLSRCRLTSLFPRRFQLPRELSLPGFETCATTVPGTKNPGRRCSCPLFFPKCMPCLCRVIKPRISLEAPFLSFFFFEKKGLYGLWRHPPYVRVCGGGCPIKFTSHVFSIDIAARSCLAAHPEKGLSFAVCVFFASALQANTHTTPLPSFLLCRLGATSAACTRDDSTEAGGDTARPKSCRERGARTQEIHGAKHWHHQRLSCKRQCA